MLNILQQKWLHLQQAKRDEYKWTKNQQKDSIYCFIHFYIEISLWILHGVYYLSFVRAVHI